MLFELMLPRSTRMSQHHIDVKSNDPKAIYTWCHVGAVSGCIDDVLVQNLTEQV